MKLKSFESFLNRDDDSPSQLYLADYLDKLRMHNSGPNKHEMFRAPRAKLYGDLRNADFSEKELRFANFEKTTLSGVLFMRSILIEANFTEADLSNVDATGANMIRATFRNTNMQGIKLKDAIMRESVIVDGSILDGSDMENVDLVGAIVTNVSMKNVKLRGAQLNYTLFEKVDFTGTDFTGVDLSKAEFIDCDLSNIAGINESTSMKPIHDLIAQNKLKEAIELLALQLPEHLKKEVSVLSAQLAQIERKERLGLVSPTETNRLYALLRNTILNLADRPDSYVKSTGLTPVDASNRGPYKVYVSFSHQDKKYLDALNKYLNPFVRSGKISLWDYTHLLPGENWETRSEQELENADLVVFLVSADLLATDWVWEQELPVVQERFGKGSLKAVSLIVRDCMWKTTPFGRFKVLPSGDKPVNRFENESEVWSKVAKSIGDML